VRYVTSSGSKHWSSHCKIWLTIVIALLSCLLIAACGDNNTGPCSGITVNCHPSSTNNPSPGVSTITSSNTPLPSPTPSPAPSPTPTPEPRTYKADWSNGLGGWTQSGGWSSSNEMLINDGSDYNNDGHPTAIAPTFPQDIANYSVQTDIRLDRYTDEGGISGEAGFGLVVRSPDQIAGDKLGVCASGGIYSCGNADHELLLSDSFIFQSPPIKQTEFRPTEGTWYTYRLDVQGNTITAWVNGSMLLQATDDKYLTAGSIGLWSDRSQISVRNFTINAL